MSGSNRRSVSRTVVRPVVSKQQVPKSTLQRRQPDVLLGRNLGGELDSDDDDSGGEEESHPMTAGGTSSRSSGVTSISDLSLVGTGNCNQYNIMTVASFARNVLFPKKKIILNDTEMEFSTTNKLSICYQLLQQVNITPSNHKSFWEDHKNVVIRELNAKRSNVAYAMRKEWLSK